MNKKMYVFSNQSILSVVCIVFSLVAFVIAVNWHTQNVQAQETTPEPLVYTESFYADSSYDTSGLGLMITHGGAVSGSVDFIDYFFFHDTNQNGMFDSNDEDLPLAVAIRLSDGENVVQEGNTDADGIVRFTDLSLPFDMYQMAIITIQDHVERSIGGQIFHDSYDDGMYDPADGDFPLNGTDVALVYPDETVEIETADENGFYEFTDLPLGNYILTIDPEDIPSEKNWWPLPAEGINDETSYVTLTSENPQDFEQDFGFEPVPGLIGGRIFHDLYDDGVYDPAVGDFPLSGAEVALVYSDETVEIGMADGDGFYEFTDLPLGDYTLIVSAETIPSEKNWWPLPAEGINDETSYVTLTSENPQNLEQDFGFEPGFEQGIAIPTSVHVQETARHVGVYTLGRIVIFVLTLSILTRVTVQPIRGKE